MSLGSQYNFDTHVKSRELIQDVINIKTIVRTIWCYLVNVEIRVACGPATLLLVMCPRNSQMCVPGVS